jgi:DNA-binding MarR family transcriptional regulator
MSELCLIAGIPASSALRLVHRLCDKQLLDLVPDTNDGRRHFVALTQDTLVRLETYFSGKKRQIEQG